MKPALSIVFLLIAMVIPARGLAQPFETIGTIHRAEPGIDALVPAGAVIEKLADGFEWTEGPVWVPAHHFVLFSDIPKNTIYQWTQADGLSVFLRPAGYAGPDPQGEELGSNGLVLDQEGRLVVCDHGNRAIARLNEQNYTKTILASTYQGKRFNSPNDVTVRSNGDLYFTDPPYGLAGLNESPDKELDFNGVYRLSPDGTVTLLTKELSFPNGIAFSPDEKTLYVANSDPERPIWMAYDVAEDGTLAHGRVFFDASAWVADGKSGMPDGMTVDQAGNLYATGPGGVNIFTPDGKHLGTIDTGQATANCTFGEDGSVLYITADMFFCRIRLNTKGIGF